MKPRWILFILLVFIAFCSVWYLTERKDNNRLKNTLSVLEEDDLQKGLRLMQEFKLEDACHSFYWAAFFANMYTEKDKELLAYRGMADCLFRLGAIDSCIDSYNKALFLAKGLGDSYNEFLIYSQLKQVYTVKVEMNDVLQIILKIDSIAYKTSDIRIKINVQQRLADEALQQHDFSLAEHYLLLTETLLDSVATNDGYAAIGLDVKTKLRNYYIGIKDYDKANKYSKQCIAIWKESIKKHQIGADLYYMGAIICAHQNHILASYKALRLYKRELIEGKIQNNEFHYNKAIGEVYSILNKWEKALDAYKKAYTYCEDATLVDHIRLLNLICDLFYQKREYDGALSCLSDMEYYIRYLYGEDSFDHADILWKLANLEELCGKIDSSKQHYINSIDVLERIVADQIRFVTVQERETFWLNFAPKMWSMPAYALKTGENQSSFTEKSYDALLFSKGFLLESDRELAITIKEKCTPEEQALYSDMINFQSQLKGLLNEYEKNKDRIETLHRKISVQNKLLSPIISSLGYTSFLEQKYCDIKNSLEDDEALLDFSDFISDENVHQHVVFIINNDQIYPKLIQIFTKEELLNLLEGKAIDRIYDMPLAEKALKLIWEPISHEIQGKRTIYYVPSGLMHQISLESIPMNDGSYLGDHYTFVRITSAREIARLKRNKQLIAINESVLYGDLKYDVDSITMKDEVSKFDFGFIVNNSGGESIRGVGNLSELPNTKEEIDSIASILERKGIRAKVQTGTKGTKESFLAMSGNAPSILHVATHGFYYTPERAMSNDYLKGYYDAMLLSGLIMTGGNTAWTGKELPKGVSDGILTANNIACMDLNGTELLVLSACQTGLGKATPEGLYGMQRAFKKAGVQTMIMTLWNVRDNVCKDFMIKFYEELFNGDYPRNKRKAFEKAKEFIRKDQRYSDPYYWAGFVMLD